MAIYDIESSKYTALKKAFVVENGKYVALKKAFVVEGGKYVKIWNSSNGVLLAGGYSGTLLRSEDGGATWETMTITLDGATITSHISEIVYGNGVLVAVIGISLCYSTDKGYTWKTGKSLSGYSGLTTHEIHLAFGNGIFVVVPSAWANTLYSTDGKTWTSTNVVIEYSCCLSFVGNKFVTTYNDQTSDANGQYYIHSSSDGKTWKRRATIGCNGDYVCVGYLSEKYYLINYYGWIEYSTDADSWTSLKSSDQVSGIGWCASGNGIIAFSGINKNTGDDCWYLDNANGIISVGSGLVSPSTVYATPTDGEMIYAEADKKFINVGKSNAAHYSANGKTWTQGTLPTDSKALYCVCFMPNE